MILLGTLVTALKSIARSLSISFDQAVEIVTDAPQYDWELFCDLAYDDGHWPRIVRNFPTDATMLSQTSEGEELPPPCVARRQDYRRHVCACVRRQRIILIR